MRPPFVSAVLPSPTYRPSVQELTTFLGVSKLRKLQTMLPSLQPGGRTQLRLMLKEGISR
jgi:hypothetical protein